MKLLMSLLSLSSVGNYAYYTVLSNKSRDFLQSMMEYLSTAFKLKLGNPRSTSQLFSSIMNSHIKS